MRAGERLATPDLVRGCAAVAAYRATLEGVVAEPSTPSGSVGMAPRPADAPLPGDAEVFAALMVIWEHVPRLEAALRLAVTGHPGMRRRGERGFLAALDAIPALAAGLDEDAEAAAARILERLANLARAVPAIDEAQRWRYVRGRACPYCKCRVTLKVLLDGRGQIFLPVRIECFAGPRASGERCLDGDGVRPAATIGTNARGQVELQWADGRIETAPDLED